MRVGTRLVSCRFFAQTNRLELGWLIVGQVREGNAKEHCSGRYRRWFEKMNTSKLDYEENLYSYYVTAKQISFVANVHAVLSRVK